MAEQLKEFNFGRLRARGGSWSDKYLAIAEGQSEGEIWKLSSEDSPSGTASMRSMQTNIANMAKRRGLKVRTNVIVEDGDEYLIIQAYIPEGDGELEDEE